MVVTLEIQSGVKGLTMTNEELAYKKIKSD